MKSVLAIFVIIFSIALTVGCIDGQPGSENESDDGGPNIGSVAYTIFTNGEFYVSYPSTWDVDIQNQDKGTDITVVGTESHATGFYIRGYTEHSTLLDFDEYVDATLAEMQSSEDATVLDYQILTNEALIETVFLSGGGDVTVYAKYKFISCADSVYLCTASTEEILRNDFQAEIDHITSTFRCV